MTLWSALTDFLLQAPPFGLVFPDEGGVFLRGGRYLKTIHAGFYWKIPFYDKIRKIPIREQVINLGDQSAKTKLGKSLGFSMTIRYEIDDPKKAILDVLDYDGSLQNMAMGAATEYAVSVDDPDYETMCNEVLKALEELEGKWGLSVIEVQMETFAYCRIIRLMHQSGALVSQM